MSAERRCSSLLLFFKGRASFLRKMGCYRCLCNGCAADVSSVCALTLAECISTKSIVFLSFRTGPKRLPRPASWGSPPPKARFLALGIHPSSGSTSLFDGKRCSMGHNASSFQDYREIHQVRKPKSQEIRSLSEMHRYVLDLSASPRQGVQRESVRPSPDVSLCTHCHDGVVRPGTKSDTPWR